VQTPVTGYEVVRLALIGSLRIRCPVAAKMALQTAGAIQGTLISPTPPIGPVLGRMWVSTCGISFMRRMG
jgi:hypothetical protein